jgi:hypothetical protein
MNVVVSVKPEYGLGWSHATFDGTGALAVGTHSLRGSGLGRIARGTGGSTTLAAVKVDILLSIMTNSSFLVLLVSRATASTGVKSFRTVAFMAGTTTLAFLAAGLWSVSPFFVSSRVTDFNDEDKSFSCVSFSVSFITWSLLYASTETDADADTLACGGRVLWVEFTDDSFLEIVVAGGVFERVVVEVDFFEMNVVVSVKPKDILDWIHATFRGTGALAVASSSLCGCGPVLGCIARATGGSTTLAAVKLDILVSITTFSSFLVLLVSRATAFIGVKSFGTVAFMAGTRTTLAFLAVRFLSVSPFFVFSRATLVVAFLMIISPFFVFS